MHGSVARLQFKKCPRLKDLTSWPGRVLGRTGIRSFITWGSFLRAFHPEKWFRSFTSAPELFSNSIIEASEYPGYVLAINLWLKPREAAIQWQ